MQIDDIIVLSEKLIANMETVIVGKRKALEQALITLYCNGHLLIEDAPGLGKTMLARSLAGSINAKFNRIQCTPDLMPADITGISIYNSENKSFEFRKGPVFSQILLVDEINRATPKTQSALLEAMGEAQVTAEGKSLPLPAPFFVIATQNGVEFEGTFPLPEAQMDRFFICMTIGYPGTEEEARVITMQNTEHPIYSIKSIIKPDDIAIIQKLVTKVYVDASIIDYIVRIVSSTRTNQDVLLGASPRGSISLYKASQARAAVFGRDYVIPEDIKALAHSVLSHRLILRPESRLRNITAKDIIDRILAITAVPLEDLSKTGSAVK
jgi:MoxR-like ATPase